MPPMDEVSRRSWTEPPGRPFIDLAIRLGLLALLVYWSFLLVQTFIPILLWSAVLAVALYPAFEWLASRLGGWRVPAAAIITVFCLLVAVGPVTWLGLGLVEGVGHLSERIGSGTLAVPPPPEVIKTWPLVGEPIHRFWELASSNFSSALAKAIPLLKPLGTSMLGVAAGAGTGILKFMLSVVIAGFLLPPAPAIVRALKTFSSRIVSGGGGQLIELAGATIRTVTRGVIGISVLQGLLAGIGLTVAGIPGASILTFAAMIAGILQIGAAIILIPVIVWSWFLLEPTAAAIFTAYMIPVNLLDNVLKPFIMARGLSTPMPVIFIGVVGGTLAHGVIGLFLGPVVLAVAWELLVAWMRDDEASAAARSTQGSGY